MEDHIDVIMYQKRRVHVLDSYICYSDTRAGEETVLFLHGNLSYSFTWRHIIPRVDGYARCLAPDLLGHGDSAKDPNETYSFLTHYNYLDAWIEAARLPKQLIIVGHDWGVALGALWASKHPDRVKGFVHMEGIVGPFPSWDQLNLDTGTQALFQKLRESPPDPEMLTMALDKNLIMETAFTKLTQDRKLSDFDMNTLKRPYVKPGEARKASVAWIRELPVEGEGDNGVVRTAEDLCAFMENSGNLPKLYIHSDPGQYSSFIQSKTANWPNQKIHVIKGRHFPQEDDPESVGDAIAAFVKSFVQSSFIRR